MQCMMNYLNQKRNETDGMKQMDSITRIFRRKAVNFEKLISYGFTKDDDVFSYKTILQDSGFEMTVVVNAAGDVSATVIDPAFHEPYTLHLADGAVGDFVGNVSAEYEKLLTEISEKCFASEVFKSAQAKELIEYVRMRYGDELEFLWKKFPDNAIWRRKDSTKWYGALLTVSKRKLGIKDDEMVEIIDLRIAPENMTALIDNKTYFPGWHMNKKNWYTIILDGSVSGEELKRRLDESYLLASK